MTQEQEAELRQWAERYKKVGLAQATPILELLDEVAALRLQVKGHCDRIAAQSELLSKKAEVTNAQ